MEIAHQHGRAQQWSDCDDDVRQWVDGIVALAFRILGHQLVGIYLHGSLAFGCYYRPKSDVDLLVVVNGPVTPKDRRAFALAMTDAAAARPTTGDLELSVIRHDATDAADGLQYEVHVSSEWRQRILEDTLDWDHTGVDPDLPSHCFIVRARGISLWGPPATEAVPATSATAYRDAVRFDLDWIVSGGIFESPIYGVLNSCRAVRVLTGSADVFSKEEGAEWALTTFPPRFRAVIEQALRCYRSSLQITDAQRRTHGHDWDEQMLEQFRAFVTDQIATL